MFSNLFMAFLLHQTWRACKILSGVIGNSLNPFAGGVEDRVGDRRHRRRYRRLADHFAAERTERISSVR